MDHEARTREIAVHDASAIASTDEARADVFHHLSIDHIGAAALFARKSRQIEDASATGDGPPAKAATAEHRAYVVGSVLAAVAFLEATANELFAAARDVETLLDPLPPDVVASFRTLWDEEGFRRSTQLLDKYQEALSLAGKDRPEKGRKPFQDAHLLVRLRNALVHSKPELLPAGLAAEARSLEKDLQNKFVPNRLVGAANPWFPERCLGDGCAAWGVRTSIRFVGGVFARLGLVP